MRRRLLPLLGGGGGPPHRAVQLREDHHVVRDVVPFEVDGHEVEAAPEALHGLVERTQPPVLAEGDATADVSQQLRVRLLLLWRLGLAEQEGEVGADQLVLAHERLPQQVRRGVHQRAAVRVVRGVEDGQVHGLLAQRAVEGGADVLHQHARPPPLRVAVADVDGHARRCFGLDRGFRDERRGLLLDHRHPQRPDDVVCELGELFASHGCALDVVPWHNDVQRGVVRQLPLLGPQRLEQHVVPERRAVFGVVQHPPHEGLSRPDTFSDDHHRAGVRVGALEGPAVRVQ
mmetsp:Transcript_20948/g.45936  ORF Transcript_20948/g.45936 Transcript_20948/m.45936 type:complete len:288 (-) Transcript_20948:604-1467(-)